MLPAESRLDRYIPEIDGLRAIAVLSVVLYHFHAQWLPGGFTGVDVFFVISGYVVSASLARRTPDSFWGFTAAFYSRRILRIFPALVVCLLVSVLLQNLFIPTAWLSRAAESTALYAFFGASNFALIWFDDGYFSPAAEFNPFTHTWSLAVEEQFYLLFPFIFFMWLKSRAGAQAQNRAAPPSPLLIGLVLLSLAICAYQTIHVPQQAFYLLPSRLWELGLGALLFQLNSAGRLVATGAKTRSLSALGGLILIGIGFMLADTAAFPMPWALLPVVGTALVIIGVIAPASADTLPARFLKSVPMVYVGKISYSMYLWHWPILVVFRWTTGLDNPVAQLSALVLIILASVMSYHLIEVPIRHLRWIQRFPKWQVVAGGLLVIAGSTWVADKAYLHRAKYSLSVVETDRGDWYPRKGWATLDGEPAPAADLAGRRLFVVGDSHAGAYVAMTQMVHLEHGVEVKTLWHAGCAMVKLMRPVGAECASRLDQYMQQILAEARPGDLVFLAALRTSRLEDFDAVAEEADVVRRLQLPEEVARREVALEEARSQLRQLQDAGLVVVIDAPKPVFKSPPYRCSDWFNRDNPACRGGLTMPTHTLLELRAPVMAMLEQLQQEFPSVVVWDPLPLLCPDETCNAFDGTRPLFFDGDHLSAHANRVLYPSFVSTVQAGLKAREG